MNMAERVLERITPRSALGLTLLTLAVIILMLGFFIQDIHVAGLDDEMDDESEALANQTLIPRPDASIRLGPGESYRTGPATPSGVGPLVSSFKDESIAPASAQAWRRPWIPREAFRSSHRSATLRILPRSPACCRVTWLG